MKTIWTISLAGNIATERQSTSLAYALQKQLDPEGRSWKVRSITPHLPSDAIRTLPNSWSTWAHELSADELLQLPCRGQPFIDDWPDIVIGCRPEVAALTLSLKRRGAQAIQIQNPNPSHLTDRFVDVTAFDAIIAQPHENMVGGAVIHSEMALHGFTPKVFAKWRATATEVLTAHIVSTKPLPVMAVLVGGPDEYSALHPSRFSELGEQILGMAETHNVFVLSSRRTDITRLQELKDAIGHHSHIHIDEGSLDYHLLLSVADKIVFPADSASMGSEAMATGKPCSLYVGRDGFDKLPNRLQILWENPVRMERLAVFPEFSAGQHEFYDELPVIARQVLLNLNREPEDHQRWLIPYLPIPKELMAFTQAIISEKLREVPRAMKPNLVHLAGIPGSGKTTYGQKLADYLSSRGNPAALIDHDLIMNCIPSYRADNEKDPVAAFRIWEMPARAIGQYILQVLIEGRRNIICDNSAADPARVELIQGCKAIGYNVEMHHVRCDVNDAIARAAYREAVTGRHTPEAMIHERRAALNNLLPQYQKAVSRFLSIDGSQPDINFELLRTLTPT